MEPLIITNPNSNTASFIEVSIAPENNPQVRAQLTGLRFNETFSVEVAADIPATYTAHSLHIQGTYQASDILSVEIELTSIPLFSNNYPYTYPF